MLNEHFKTLELHKILEMLSDICSNQASKELALNIEPSSDLETVQNEIDKTSEAFNLSSRFGTPVFYNIKDIITVIKRADSGVSLSYREILDVAKVLNQVRVLNSWFAQTGDSDTKLNYLFESLFPNKYLEDKIYNTIISEDEISDNASPELASIRKKILQASSKIRDSLEKMIKSSEASTYLQDSIVTIRDGRYVVPVKSEHRGKVSGLVHDTSASGATLFIEPIAVVEANNEIKVLKGKEHDEIERIISEISAECAQCGKAIISGYKAAVKLNLYFSKANLAAKMNAMTPIISDDGQIALKKARHPLISADKVVPIDFRLGGEYDTLIITGPNTGGKTVTLKTVGLLTLMTMCGLLIPASDGSRISIFKNILVDIGDQQSIEQSLSTFSSHMNKVISILNTADSNSLVLIDELGSGTDPVEGAALAVSIIEKLHSLGAKLVTTTHYQELKLYAIDTPNVENASCEFDVKTLQPTYRLIIGSPGKSNAFAISSRLGLPQDIISRAEGLVSGENRKIENIIDKLETMRSELEKSEKEAYENKKKSEDLIKELEKQKEELLRQKEAEIEKARRQARAIVDKVTRESQALIDELDAIRKDKDKENFSKMAINAKSSHKRTIDKLYLEANPVSSSDDGYKLPRALKKGDNVIVKDTGKKGFLISEPDSGGECFVQIGIMKTKLNVSKLRLAEGEKITLNDKKIKKPKQGSISTKGVESRATRRVELELDIRGYSSDEGIYEVDRFLDNAVMNGLQLVTIIHGNGTGVLKAAVRRHLKNHPHVKSSRRGVYGEGEDGVTVVELK